MVSGHAPDRPLRAVAGAAVPPALARPDGQALAGAFAAGVGTPETLLLAGLLMCVPNLFVLGFVREVRTVRRGEEPAPVTAG